MFPVGSEDREPLWAQGRQAHLGPGTLGVHLEARYPEAEVPGPPCSIRFQRLKPDPELDAAGRRPGLAAPGVWAGILRAGQPPVQPDIMTAGERFQKRVETDQVVENAPLPEVVYAAAGRFQDLSWRQRQAVHPSSFWPRRP